MPIDSKTINEICKDTKEGEKRAKAYFNNAELMKSFYASIHKNDKDQINRIILLTRFIIKVNKYTNPVFEKNIIEVYDSIFSGKNLLNIFRKKENFTFLMQIFIDKICKDDQIAKAHFNNAEFMKRFYAIIHKNDKHQINRIILLTRFIIKAKADENKKFQENITNALKNNDVFTETIGETCNHKDNKIAKVHFKNAELMKSFYAKIHENNENQVNHIILLTRFIKKANEYTNLVFEKNIIEVYDNIFSEKNLLDIFSKKENFTSLMKIFMDKICKDQKTTKVYFSNPEFMERFYKIIHENDKHQTECIILLTGFIRKANEYKNPVFEENIIKVYDNIFSRKNIPNIFSKKDGNDALDSTQKNNFYRNLKIITKNQKQVETFIVQELFMQSQNNSKENITVLMDVFVDKHKNWTEAIEKFAPIIEKNLKGFMDTRKSLLSENDSFHKKSQSQIKVDLLLVILQGIEYNIDKHFAKITGTDKKKNTENTNVAIAKLCEEIHIVDKKVLLGKKDPFINSLTNITIRSIQKWPFLWDNHESYASLVTAEYMLGEKIRDHIENDDDKEWLKQNIEKAFIFKCQQEIRDINLTNTLKICYGNQSALTKRIQKIGEEYDFPEKISRWLALGAKENKIYDLDESGHHSEQQFDKIFANLLMELISLHKKIQSENNEIMKQKIKKSFTYVKEIMQVRKIKMRNKVGEILKYKNISTIYDLEKPEDCDTIKITVPAIIRTTTANTEIILLKGKAEKHD